MERKKITDYNFEKNDSLFYFKNVLKNTGWKVFYKLFHRHIRRPWSRNQLQNFANSGYGLEIGCGTWTIAPSQRTIFSDAYTSHAGNKSLAQVFFDASEIPYDNESFSFVLSEHVLEHIYNPIKTINEWKRVLKENGKPIITGLAASNGSHLDLSGTKTTYLPSTGQHYFFSVSKVSTDRAILYREDTRFQLIAQNGNTSTNTRNDPNYLSNTYRKNGASYSPTNRDEVHTSFSSQHLLTINGSLDNGVSSFVLGYGASNFANYSMQEFIVYEGDLSNIQIGLEKEINNYYSIF